MKEYSTLARLYHLLINADGEIHQNEIKMGHIMVNHQGLDEMLFKLELDKIAGMRDNEILDECIKGMTTLSKEQQINYMAWMTAIANSDGLMDDKEWSLIYNIYHKKLSLPYQEVMKRQKEINAMIKAQKKAELG